MKTLKTYEGFINKINEGSYTDFLMDYGQEIKDAIKKLRKLKDFELTEEIYDKLENSRFANYDTNVLEYIESWAYRGDLDAEQIADLGLRNQNTWGTEPKQILNAIDDFYDIVSKYAGVQEEEEYEEEYEDKGMKEKKIIKKIKNKYD